MPPRRRRRYYDKEVGHGQSAFMTMFGGVLGCFFGLLVIVAGVICLVVWSCNKITQKAEEVDSRQKSSPDAPDDSKPKAIPLAGRQAVTLSGVTVEVASVSVGPVAIAGSGLEPDSTLENEHLSVTVRISIADATRKIRYSTWRDLPHPALAHDNFGNQFVRVTPPFLWNYKGGIKSGSLTKDSPLSDVLVFEKPLRASQYIDLDLPGAAVGLKSSDVFRFRIPSGMLREPAKSLTDADFKKIARSLGRCIASVSGTLQESSNAARVAISKGDWPILLEIVTATWKLIKANVNVFIVESRNVILDAADR